MSKYRDKDIMKLTKTSNKVVNLTTRMLDKKAGTVPGGKQPLKSNTRVIAITSGKGGVGKTNIVANLGYALSKLGKKVLILDADAGLGNIDILLGIAPRYNFSHVITGTRSIREVIIEGPGNMKILPSASGIQELTLLTGEQKMYILTELDMLIDSIDVLLIDTAAGISSNVMSFNAAAQEIIVVVSPEPTSMTDAYALMKVLSLKYSETHFKLLINMAGNEDEAKDIFRQLNLVSDKFLDIAMEYVGCVLLDENIPKSVRRQKLVSEIYPDSPGSRSFVSLARLINETSSTNFPKGGTNFFWKYFLEAKNE